MANFQQAIKWLNEGKKVRRKSWSKDSYFDEARNGLKLFSCEKESGCPLLIGDLKATNWEIYEEEDFCLDKHIFYGSSAHGMDDYLEVENVKEFIKIIKDELGKMWAMGEGTVEDIWKKIDKRAGKKLT